MGYRDFDEIPTPEWLVLMPNVRFLWVVVFYWWSFWHGWWLYDKCIRATNIFHGNGLLKWVHWFNVVLGRVCITVLNVPCGYIFCSKCIVEMWIHCMDVERQEAFLSFQRWLIYTNKNTWTCHFNVINTQSILQSHWWMVRYKGSWNREMKV